MNSCASVLRANLWFSTLMDHRRSFYAVGADVWVCALLDILGVCFCAIIDPRTEGAVGQRIDWAECNLSYRGLGTWYSARQGGV